MPAEYTLAKDVGTGSTTDALFNLATTAGNGLHFTGFMFGDAATGAQLSSRNNLARSTAGTVGTAQTPELIDIDSHAAVTTAASEMSVSPAFSGQPLISMGIDIRDNGGVNREWTCHPRFPIVVRPSAQLTFYSFPGAAGIFETRTGFWREGSPSIRDIRNRGIRRGYWHQHSHAFGRSASTNQVNKSASQFTMYQKETWPESFIPVNNALLFAAATPEAEPVRVLMAPLATV